ncbi:MAG: type 4a pilus biogenesis protein PilO [Longimicrobiales bacterium]
MALLPTDPQQQKKLLIGLVPLLLLFAYYQFYHGGRTVQVEELATHLESLETANNAARVIAAQGGPELQRRLAIYEEHMRRLEELIPSREEVADLLHSMGLRAQGAGSELTKMNPEADEPGPYYTKRTYEMGVSGTYHEVGTFLSEVGSLERIVTPTELKLARDPQETNNNGTPLVDAGFRIVTYVLPEPTSMMTDTTRVANAR